jgi:hypothetical protein
MRNWNLKVGDPLSLNLSSDSRITPTNYLNDHNWVLSIGSGEPKAISIETTFGLRAKSFRLFPLFRVNGITRSDPSEFPQTVTIHHVYPNYIELDYIPFDGLLVRSEYWIPKPHVMAIRLKILNIGIISQSVRTDWIGQLAPNHGQRMSIVQVEATTVLCGETDGLFPVLFVTGSPKEGSGSFPSIMSSLEMAPDEERIITCIVAVKTNREESFYLAREVATMRWEAEIARLEMINANIVDIYTGNEDWDAALMFSQIHAISLLQSSTEYLPNTSFVYSRRPDQGFSITGDGFDYNYYWNGQAPLETYFLCDVLLPIAPELCEGLLQNFLFVQEENGEIDWKPGLGGQRSRRLATPIISSLAWKIFEQTENLSFLKEAYPKLFRFFLAWFSEKYDRDNDGIPEWDSPHQLGAEDHPLYSELEPWSQGVQIFTSESPALISLLYAECQALINIAKLIDSHADIPKIEVISERLKVAIDESWDEATSCYYDRDRDTHQISPMEWVGGLVGSGGISINQEYEKPFRLLIHLNIHFSSQSNSVIFVHGTSSSGKHRVERITYDDFRWNAGKGTYTGKLIYSGLERIEVNGIEEYDEISIYRAGYQYSNITLLAPLWANVIDDEHARQLVDMIIKGDESFWYSFGIPFCPNPPDHPDAMVCRSVDMIWNMLIAEGLVKYKYRETAADLFERNINAIVMSLRDEKAFHRYYNADHGKGVGIHGILSGITPIGLFLKILGVQLLSSNKVIVEGHNPFPKSVSIKYKGLTILRKKDRTTIIFPDGRSCEITDTEKHTITLEAIS